MQAVRILLLIVSLVLIDAAWAISKNTESACPDPEFICPYFGMLVGLSCTFDGAACEGKDCEGLYQGEEMSVVATGAKYKRWITRHEGDVNLQGLFLPCDMTLRPDLTIVDVPNTACAFNLVTNTHLYMEHFVSNPDVPCFGWAECPCELPQ